MVFRLFRQAVRHIRTIPAHPALRRKNHLHVVAASSYVRIHVTLDYSQRVHVMLLSLQIYVQLRLCFGGRCLLGSGGHS